MFKVRKRNILWALLLSGSFALNGCSSGDDPIPEEPPIIEEEPSPGEEPVLPSERVKVVNMTADNIVSGNAETRTAFTLESDKLKFAWAENDQVGIYPTSGTQIAFTISSGAGKNSATFDGGAWALRETETYAAYYPYDVENTARSNAELRFSYEGQHQTGKGSLAHLGAHDLMATNATTAMDGELTFKFKHLNSVALLNLTVPVAATFTTLTLRCDQEALTKVANLDMSGSEYAYSTYETTDRLQMQLTDVASAQADKTLRFYMMLPPVDMTGKIFNVILRSSDNRVYQDQLVSKTMQPGHAYLFAATLVDVTMASTINSPSFGDSDSEV